MEVDGCKKHAIMSIAGANFTPNAHFNSEGTQRSVCVRGGGAHKVCFMVIGEVP